MLDKHPALKQALANQYQAILLAGALAFSAVLASPLPLLLLLGGELVALPLLVERLRRRLDIERRHAERQVHSISQEQQHAELSPASKGRFARLQQTCAQIQHSTRGLSAASRSLVADQAAKLDAILVAFLRRLWLLEKYDAMMAGFDEPGVRADVARLGEALGEPDLAPRIREAWQQNLQIKQALLEAVERNRSHSAALLAELDSIEALLQLLLQKSLAFSDAEAFSAELDDVLAQAEADAASVQEMEQLVGAMPQLQGPTVLSEKLKGAVPPAVTPLRAPVRRVPEGRPRRS